MDRNHQINDGEKIDPGSSDATIVVNQSGTITFANQQAYENFGYSENDLIGKNLSELMPEVNLQYTEEGKVMHQYGLHNMGHAFSLFFRVNSFSLGEEVFFSDCLP